MIQEDSLNPSALGTLCISKFNLSNIARDLSNFGIIDVDPFLFLLLLKLLGMIGERYGVLLNQVLVGNPTKEAADISMMFLVFQ